MILIKDGMVCAEGGFTAADVVIEGREIIAVGHGYVSEAAGAVQVIDASGCLVGPGFVDIHVHFREPGQTWKEDIESGSRAAAAGGFTAVVMMANTSPPIDHPGAVRRALERGEEVGLVEVAVAASMTAGHGEAPTDLEALYDEGVRMFSDDGASVLDGSVLRSIMERLAGLDGAVVCQHAEDSAMTAGGHMHEGAVSARLGIGGLPSEAESSVVRRDLGLVEATGAAYHCQHVSAAATVELIREAKAEGLPVTAEVTPHHLVFDDTALEGLDTNFKMYPPIRAAADRDALRDALGDGTIDVVATDHAPHTADEKATTFELAPRGVIGLETAASAVRETVGDPGRLFDAMSSAPALVAGLERQGRPLAAGGPANVVVLAPDDTWAPRTFESRSSNSPFLGRRMRGRVRATVSEGNIAWRLGDGE